MRLDEFAAPGTYAAVKLDENSAKELHEFCKSIGLENLVDPSDLHCTLLYSRNACPEIEDLDFGLPFTANPKSYKILGEDNKVLTIELSCQQATKLHDLFIKEHNGTHDYDVYLPHISLTTEYSADTVPDTLPDFDLIFTGKIVQENIDD